MKWVNHTKKETSYIPKDIYFFSFGTFVTSLLPHSMVTPEIESPNLTLGCGWKDRWNRKKDVQLPILLYLKSFFFFKWTSSCPLSHVLAFSHCISWCSWLFCFFSSDKKKQKQVFSWKFAVFGKQKMNPDWAPAKKQAKWSIFINSKNLLPQSFLTQPTTKGVISLQLNWNSLYFIRICM